MGLGGVGGWARVLGSGGVSGRGDVVEGHVARNSVL